MEAGPCPFDTLKFTGPDTRFYWASAIDWKRYYAHIKQQEKSFRTGQDGDNPTADAMLNFIQLWVRSANLDAGATSPVHSAPKSPCK